MTKIPEPQNTIASKIDGAHEKRRLDEKPRPYLGASVLGHSCERWLWLSFRWAVLPVFAGRILRLFRRGQNEESTVIADLAAIGIRVEHTGDDQLRLELGPHMSGHPDGLIAEGVPEATKTPHTLEIKTHNKKSFNAVEKHGVQKSKPQHWAQCQVCMVGAGVERCLYFAICKDDDRIYTERIRLDREEAEKILARGREVVLADRPPPPVSSDPDWFECRFCDARDFCHQSKLARGVNCRTCAHVTPLESGDWHCARYDQGGMPVDFQRKGCECHVLHPDLVPWQRVEPLGEFEAAYVIEGQTVRNGEPCRETFASREIVFDPKSCAEKPQIVLDAREMFDGRIITEAELPF